MGRTLVIMPVAADARTAALLRTRALAVDPARWGADRCEIALSERELLVLLEGERVGPGGDLNRRVASWEGWVDLLTGPPRTGEWVRSWSGGGELAGVFYGPLPGPGDSEGGGSGI